MRTRGEESFAYSPDVTRVQEWARVAREIVSNPKDRTELLDLAAMADTLKTYALVRACSMPETDPKDHELLTPQEVAGEFRRSLWCVREAMRRKQLQGVPPYPGATRNLKVPRGVAKAWAGGR